MDLSNVLIVAIIFFGCYKVIEILVHRKERIKLVDKIDFARDNNVDIAKVLGNNVENYNPNWALRIGAMLAGLGLGIVVAYIIVSCIGLYGMVASKSGYYLHEQISTIYAAGALLFGGAGLVLAYFLEKKNCNKK